jgi:leader peptidase (prepilin peptidase)/N-methyltransferase
VPDLPLLSGPVLLATVLLYTLLWRLARIDMGTGRLPDLLTLPLLGLGLGWSAWVAGGLPWAALAGAGAGYLLFAGLGWVWWRTRGVEALGLGDAKLYAAGGAWLGWQALPWIALLAAGTALVAALAGRLDGRIAFGPWLAAAIALLWAIARLG